MRKSIISFVLSLSLILSSFSFAEPIEEGVSAYLAGNTDTGEIIMDYNLDKPVAIASTTKIMTYLVVRDLISEGKGSLEDIVTISPEAAKIEGSTYNLKKGERIMVKELLESMMIVSANDSTYALAEYFGKSIPEFVSLMNSKAKELGLLNTVYYTVNGLENENKQENMMSAKELFILSSHLVNKYPDVLETTKKLEMNTPNRDFREANSNALLNRIEGLDGLKTGFTDKAGRCLVATGKSDKDSFRAISIVMGADSIESRDNKSEVIIKDLFNNYKENLIYNKDKVVAERYINDSKYVKIDMVPKEDFHVTSNGNVDMEIDVSPLDRVNIPIKAGETVGKMTVKYGNNTREVDLTVDKDVSRTKFFQLWFKGFLDSLNS